MIDIRFNSKNGDKVYFVRNNTKSSLAVGEIKKVEDKKTKEVHEIFENSFYPSSLESAFRTLLERELFEADINEVSELQKQLKEVKSWLRDLLYE